MLGGWLARGTYISLCRSPMSRRTAETKFTSETEIKSLSWVRAARHPYWSFMGHCRGWDTTQLTVLLCFAITSSFIHSFNKHKLFKYYASVDCGVCTMMTVTMRNRESLVWWVPAGKRDMERKRETQSERCRHCHKGRESQVKIHPRPWGPSCTPHQRATLRPRTPPFFPIMSSSITILCKTIVTIPA